MERIKAINPENAVGETETLLRKVESELGQIPNFARVLANSPAVLVAYYGMQEALATGSLSPKLREQLNLFISQMNHCTYSIAAHAAIGRTIGMRDEELQDSRRGVSPHRRTETALQFARQIHDTRGHVEADALADLRKAGFEENEIVELIAQVALAEFTNYINNAAVPVVDFPGQPELPQ
jgi:uncharacterized peroxidase-related enzyme